MEGESSRSKGPMSLLEKVAKSGGKSGYALEEQVSSSNSRRRNWRRNDPMNGSRSGRRKRKQILSYDTNTKKVSESGYQKHRSFKTPGSKPTSHEQVKVARMIPTPRFLKVDDITPLHQRLTNREVPPSSITGHNITVQKLGSSVHDTTSPSDKSSMPRNPYKHRRIGSSHTSTSRSKARVTEPCNGHVLQSSLNCESNRKLVTTHSVCAISENLARETCISFMDAGRPTLLTATKQGNGQTYAEALTFLEHLRPDEILLNEGRRNSQLVRKIMNRFQISEKDDDGVITSNDMKLCSVSNATPHNHSKGRLDMKSTPSVQTAIKFVPRTYFDQTKGAELLKRVVRPSNHDALVGEYILLSSCHAVIEYIQNCLGASFCRNSLELDLNWGGKDRMAIDRSTLMHLELLSNAKTGKSRHSVLGTIDKTVTTIGSRLLRTNLMSPPTRKDTIDTRLDLVDIFLEDEEFFYEVMEQLEALPEIDKMLSHMTLVPKCTTTSSSRKNSSMFGRGSAKRVTTRMASRGISAIVCIKSFLSVVPNMARILELKMKSLSKRDKDDLTASQKKSDASNAIGSQDESMDESISSLEHDASTIDESEKDSASDKNGQSCDRLQLLTNILEAMKQPALKEILDVVLDVVTESTTYNMNTHAMRHQECFALKPNTDGMLDVLRKAFLANVDDIYRLADTYSEQFGLTVAVRETTARGYYLSIPISCVSAELPPLFIQPVKSGRYINCTTEDVHSFNARAQENVEDMLLMTHERIQTVIDIARQKYDALASLSDAIALLDMCHCFADNVASSHGPWCRPYMSDCGEDNVNQNTHSHASATEIGGSGAFAIRNGRYAIDTSDIATSSTDNPETYIPNDTYASSFQNFTVITGINGAGKSLYLKQIAITVILAHCGSYVPAEEAFIPVRDCLCTRIGTSDDPEHNISTFMQEMKETAFICSNATDKSLILIDELGRATSNEDGVAIAWSVAEYLLLKRAMTFFVTHYSQLAAMAEIYPNVQNQHLGAVVDVDSASIRYMHKILPGPCQMTSDYGIEMASICGWKPSVIRLARNIRKSIETKLPNGALCQKEMNPDFRNMEARQNVEELLTDIIKHLAAMKEGNMQLSDEAKRSYLQDLKLQFLSNQSNESIVHMMKHLLSDDDDDCIRFLHLKESSPILCDDRQDADPSLHNSTKSGTCDDSTISTHEQKVNENLIKSQGRCDLYEDVTNVELDVGQRKKDWMMVKPNVNDGDSSSETTEDYDSSLSFSSSSMKPNVNDGDSSSETTEDDDSSLSSSSSSSSDDYSNNSSSSSSSATL